jgi:hypothetical protein
MKTSLACLGLLIAALVIGRFQVSRIEKLQHRIDYTQALRKMKVSDRDHREQPSGYRTKYARKSAGTTAAQALEVLISVPRPQTGASLQPDAAIENREAMQAITQLDLPGLEELMKLIAHSKDRALQSPYGQEKAILCLVAIADLNPRKALEHLMEGKDWHRLFSRHEHAEGRMLGYVLARMSDRDPQGALDTVLEMNRNSPERMNDESVSELLGSIARQDPGLVLEALDRLPEAKRKGVLNAFSYQLESDDQQTTLFLALRAHYGSQPQVMKEALTALCQRFVYDANLPADSRKWADGLGMTDVEKLLMADGLKRINYHPGDGEDYARWFATFMPDSQERNELIWMAVKEWAPSDPNGSWAFLKAQGIDAEEMVRREMGRN